MNTNYLIFFIFTLLISSSFLYTWFNSSLPNLIFYFIKKLGIIKNKDFWKTNDIGEINPMDWTDEDWAIFRNRLGLLGHLISCRFCMCYHIVFWSNIFIYLIFYLNNIDISFIMLIPIILSQPILVHLIYGLTDKFNK